MSQMIPEVIFETTIDNEGPDGVLRGGRSWYGMYEYTSNADLYYRIGKVIHITELSALDQNVHTTRENGLKFDVMKFPNNAVMGISVYVKTEFSTYETVYVAGFIKYGTTYYFDNFYCGTAGGGQWSVESSYCPVNIVKQFGLKLFLNTNYDYGNTQAIVDETRAVYVQMCCLVPFTNTGQASGFQSFAHINDESLYFTQLYDDGDPSDWISNPQYMYFGYNYGPMLGSVWGCADLTDFNSKLNSLAPMPTDPWKLRDPDDPSQEVDPSAPGGGGGNMDPSSDPIPFPDLPVGGALLSGAIKAFEVTPTAMTQMFLKLWDTSIFDIATFQKLVEAPLDSLIQLQCVPMDPHTSGTAHIMLGNFDTEAVGSVIDQEYYTIDCGTLTVEEYWGSALDYSPYTSAEIWVPMVGFRDLDINDIMGKTIHLKYNYSIFDGNLTAQLMCGNAVLYKWPGNVKETIPVTAKVSDALQRIVSGVMGVATAGTGAGMAAAAIGAAVNVAMSKTHVSRTGEMSGSTGLLDDFMPFLIIHRPIQSLAAGFKSQKGYPSNISSILSACSGYTEVEYIHLTGISGATDTELEEIEQLLKNGVII